MKTSCIRHPEKNRSLQLHQWQVQFCKHNHSAAVILAFVINWHDRKCTNDQSYRLLMKFMVVVDHILKMHKLVELGCKGERLVAMYVLISLEMRVPCHYEFAKVIE